jgi:hypothetical protein
MTDTIDKLGPVAPINIAIVGTGTTEGGGVAPTPNGTIVETPAGQPNLRINVIRPEIAFLVRFVTLYLQTFIGILTAAGFGNVTGINAKVFAAPDLATLVAGAAWASLIVAVVGLGKNLITVLGRLEGKYPLLTGSI